MLPYLVIKQDSQTT